MSQSFKLTVTRKGFYFVDPAGDDASAGTLDKPWKTFMRARSGKCMNTPAEAIIYLRDGEYQIDNPAKEKSPAAATHGSADQQTIQHGSNQKQPELCD